MGRYKLHKRYRRDPYRPRIAGVCLALAQQLGVKPKLVRVAAILSLVFFFFPTLVIYGMLSLVLKPREPMQFATPEGAAFWQGLAKDPPRSVQSMRDSLRRAEQRVRALEEAVTSNDFDLRRRFRDLGA
jgi:phage shock protein C